MLSEPNREDRINYDIIYLYLAAKLSSWHVSHWYFFWPDHTILDFWLRVILAVVHVMAFLTSGSQEFIGNQQNGIRIHELLTSSNILSIFFYLIQLYFMPYEISENAKHARILTSCNISTITSSGHYYVFAIYLRLTTSFLLSDNEEKRKQAGKILLIN